MRRFSLASLVAVVFAALVVAAPASAGTLDQQQTESNSESLFGTCPAAVCMVDRQIALAQTFTAGLTGLLDQVDLELRRTDPAAPPLTVEIRTVAADGCPSTTVLATQSVPAAAIPTALGLVAITFSAPAAVVAGAQYAIVLYTEPGPDLPYTASVQSGGDPYTRGRICQSRFDAPPSSAPPTSWEGSGDSDLVFKTYVVVTCKGQQATHVGTEGNDGLTGTPGPDVIAALGGNDQVRGLGANDLICGGSGKDTLKGGKGNDRLLGQGGKDKLSGQAGKDKLLGKGGRDLLNGGNGKDVCKGGKKDDTAKKCEVEKSI